jgi:hypothetical protein
MPIADGAHIQEQTDLGDKATLLAKRRLRRAERWVRQQIGDDAYEAGRAADDVESVTDPDEDDYLREDIKDAEALYAAATALRNHQLGSGGDEGFVRAIQVDGAQSEQKMSQQELKAYAMALEDEAREAIARHRQADSGSLSTTMDRFTDTY